MAMSFDKDQALENGRHCGEKTQIKGEMTVMYFKTFRVFLCFTLICFAAINENDEQLQFNLELNPESSSPNPLTSTKGKA